MLTGQWCSACVVQAAQKAHAELSRKLEAAEREKAELAAEVQFFLTLRHNSDTNVDRIVWEHIIAI